jgi:hypothetical protein
LSWGRLVTADSGMMWSVTTQDTTVRILADVDASKHAGWSVPIPILALVLSCGGGDEAGDEVSSKSATGTSTGTDASTSSGETDTSSDAETDTSSSETDTSSEEPCTDDAACIELGLVCNESSGLCVAPDCAGEPDFTLCETQTSPDRAYDICVGEVCVSPGCGDLSCNVPAPHFPLADTNQRQCYDASAAMTCPAPGQPFYGQDAQYGWDTLHAASERFTRDLGVVGEPVVADSVTALVWQGCPLGLSGDDCSNGFATKAAWAEQLAGCDALSWGGYDDWRLPDPYEMQTLVDHDIPGPPTIDAMLFPATTLDWFWSSSSSVDTDWAWTLHFGFGTVGSDYKPNTRSARCVRGGALQARHFEPSLLASDPIVTDTQSGLIWQGCPLGLSGDACGTGLITWSTWADALAYCEGLAWAGLEGWRLPDINELQSIVDYRYESTSLDPSVFPGLSSSGWSSTTRPAFTGSAMAVNFEVGTTYASSKEQPGGSARCVRDP